MSDINDRLFTDGTGKEMLTELRRIANYPAPSDEQVQTSVNNYLDEHPVSPYDDTEIRSEVASVKADLHGLNNEVNSNWNLRLGDVITKETEYTNHSISSSTGQTSPNFSDVRASSDYIYFPKNATIKRTVNSGYAIILICWYDINHNFLGIGTTPLNNSNYMRIVAYKPNGDTITPQEAKDNITITVKYGVDNFLNGKVGLSFGDSIVQGAGNNNEGILDILAEKYSIVVNDKSVSGASCAYHSDRSHIVAQIENTIPLNISPDFIIIDGLSNDIVHSDKGVLTDSFDYLTNGYDKFVNGLEYCFGLLKDNYPSVPIIYVLPHSSLGRNYANELDYGNTARDICKKWSIPCVDVYTNGNLTSRVNTQLTRYTNYPTESTGTHPNRLGYDHSYIPLIYAELKRIFEE